MRPSKVSAKITAAAASSNHTEALVDDRVVLVAVTALVGVVKVWLSQAA